MPNYELQPIRGTNRRAPTERAGSTQHPIEPTPPKDCEDTRRTRRCPTCKTSLAELIEVEALVILARGQIELIGFAGCQTCGKQWVFADCWTESDESEVRAKLHLLARSVLQPGEILNLRGANHA